MTNPTAEQIHRVWWDLCGQGRPVTVHGLAQALHVPESIVCRALSALGYLDLMAPTPLEALDVRR